MLCRRWLTDHAGRPLEDRMDAASVRPVGYSVDVTPDLGGASVRPDSPTAEGST
jgi:hypothetical protein